jgi:DNA-binding response OmpR family regulator
MGPAKILIVEDDPIIASLVELRLKKLGYAVSGKTRNEPETLHAIASGLPDLILMDINLEGETDGISLTKKILQENNVPVVFLTGQTDDDTLKRVKEIGTCGFIIKPFNDHDLRVSIELNIDKKG